MLAAGDLDRRITIQRAMTVTDELGSEVPAWIDLTTVWASVEWVKDGERFRAAEVAAYAEVRFTIRWGVGVTAQDRVRYDGRVYEIVGPPKEIGRRVGQEISASGRAEVPA